MGEATRIVRVLLSTVASVDPTAALDGSAVNEYLAHNVKDCVATDAATVIETIGWATIDAITEKPLAVETHSGVPIGVKIDIGGGSWIGVAAVAGGYRVGVMRDMVGRGFVDCTAETLTHAVLSAAAAAR